MLRPPRVAVRGQSPSEGGGAGRPHGRTLTIITLVSVADHRQNAPGTVRCFVLTISDTRGPEDDRSGDAIVGLLATAGHLVAARAMVKDDPEAVRHALHAQRDAVDVAITTGGTGIAARDTTYEAIAGLLEKRLDGFGELFRMLSFNDIGAAAMLSRACAGTIGRMAVFALPGSEAAVRLAMTRLIVPEIGHIVRELHR